MEELQGSYNIGRTCLAEATSDLLRVVEKHLFAPATAQPGLIQSLICPSRPFNSEAATIAEMEALTEFLSSVKLVIETWACQYNIPAESQYDGLLIPRQVCWEQDQKEFLNACTGLIRERYISLRILMEGWKTRSHISESIPPDNLRIVLWRHVNPSNGFPHRIQSWTTSALRKETRKLRKNCDLFEQGLGQGKRFEEAVRQAFGAETSMSV